MRRILFTALTIGVMASASAQAPAAAPVTAPAAAPPGSASTLAPDATLSKSDQAMRCRSVKVTGTLVKKGKVCKSLAEWRQITDSGNELARRLVEDGTSRPGGQ